MRSSPLVAPYLANGLPEHALGWVDEKSGIAMKGRLDWLAPGTVLDLKTARFAINPRAFTAEAVRLGYWKQLALYRMGASIVTGQEHDAVVVAVEPTPPYDIAVYRLNAEDLSTAVYDIDQMLATLQSCRATDSWPGRFALIQELRMPAWALALDESTVTPDPDWAEGA